MATETTNFGFKKPAETDYYDVNVQNDNWDKADQEIKKRVEEEGGDIADTKAVSFQDNSTSWPVPAAGETVKVILGKIKKHLEDLASWRPTVSLIANIVDNCTSTNTDKPLSAKQGKVLQDQITQVNSDFSQLYVQYVSKVHAAITQRYINVNFTTVNGVITLIFTGSKMVTLISADINSATDSLSSSPCEFQNLVGAAITDAAIATGGSENRYRIKLTLNAPPGAIDIAFLVGGVSSINIAGSDN